LRRNFIFSKINSLITFYNEQVRGGNITKNERIIFQPTVQTPCGPGDFDVRELVTLLKN
jgi:hypothetical protein